MTDDPGETVELDQRPTTIMAAGAVLWRAGADGAPEVALVHRPRYDDWSLPKGKLHADETTQRAAVREIAEETGFRCVLARLLSRSVYPVPTSEGESATKLVEYFAAHATGGSFEPNAEVDELRWLGADQARRLLSYPGDAQVLAEFERLPVDVATVLLVRHAKAGKRSDWSGDDDLRPLSEAGRRQSAALRTLLALFGPERVHSAPRLRCEQTVAPLAADLGADIRPEPLLSEEGYWPDPRAGVDRLLRIAAGAGTPVISSQGGVIPDLVARLAREGGLTMGEVPSRKGSVWTLTFQRARHSANGTGPTPQLVAADYLDDPLSAGTVLHGR